MAPRQINKKALKYYSIKMYAYWNINIDHVTSETSHPAAVDFKSRRENSEIVLNVEATEQNLRLIAPYYS
jgi:hypothetical protein